MAETNRWGVVYSSRSGNYKAHKRWNHIRAYMEQKGVQYDFVQSESSDSVYRLANMLCNNGYHTLIIVGGDRALNDGVNAVMNNLDTLPEDFAMGVVPNGNGNDYARFWGLTADNYRQTIDTLIARRVRKIDVGTCVFQENGIPRKHYFLNCINIGMGARLIKASNDAMHLIGSKRLSLIPVIISQLFERRQFNFSMKVDTEEVNSEFMSICIGKALGYGQTPNAVPYNGFLDMSAITRPKWWQLFEGFWLLGKGRFLNYKNVHPFRAAKIIIENCDKASISIDGQYIKVKDYTPVKVELEHEVLRFII